MLFEGEIHGKGKPDSLRSERNKNTGNPQLSAVFVMGKGEKGRNYDRGQVIDVGGEEATWYKSLTSNPKTREIALRELKNAGMSAEEAEEFVSEAEAGNFMQVEGSGFGSKTASLTIAVKPDPQGTPRMRVDWVNDLDGSGRGAPKAEVPVGRLRSSKAGAASTPAQTEAKPKADAPWMKE